MNISKHNKQASKLLCQKVEQKLLSICPISGIAITIEAPAIPGYALEYRNPLAESSNFLKIAELSSKQLEAFEQPILAGLLLSALQNWELLAEQPTLTIAEQNIALQTVHPTVLISSFKYLCLNLSAARRRYSTIDRLNICYKDEMEKQNSSISSQVKAFMEGVKLAVNPPIPTVEESELNAIYQKVESLHILSSSSRIQKAREAARKTKEADKQDKIKTGKRLVKELQAEGHLSEKLYGFLQLLFKKDAETGQVYLEIAEASLKERITAALMKRQNPKCKELISIINGESFESIEALFTFNAEQDKAAAEQIVEVEAEVKPKLTLAQILAAKIASK